MKLSTTANEISNNSKTVTESCQNKLFIVVLPLPLIVTSIADRKQVETSRNIGKHTKFSPITGKSEVCFQMIIWEYLLKYFSMKFHMWCVSISITLPGHLYESADQDGSYR